MESEQLYMEDNMAETIGNFLIMFI